MFLKLTHFFIFQLCKIITRYKNISDINHFDFNTFPSSKIELKKHVENGIFRNSNFNKNIQELKIRGNENVILSISSFSWLFLFSALNTHSTRKNTEYLFPKMITLPLHLDLNLKDIDFISNTIKQIIIDE